MENNILNYPQQTDPGRERAAAPRSCTAELLPVYREGRKADFHPKQAALWELRRTRLLPLTPVAARLVTAWAPVSPGRVPAALTRIRTSGQTGRIRSRHQGRTWTDHL